MHENLRRRKAAHLLRERAADALEQASELDGWPRIHLEIVDMARIAEALGVTVSAMEEAVESLFPGRDMPAGDQE